LVPLAIAGPLETALSSIPKVTAAAPGISAIDNLSRVIGEFIAYWAVLAVFAYYYEVIARYVFNSPTNWVHESMFLMFGMQYMLAGAYAYRDETHVRVDIIYSHLSLRGRAICDLITSFFFFLFAGTMLFTGWRFASDAIAVGETSFTEWGIQYWPVKLAIPIGAALLVLQGVSRVARDVAVLMRKPV
jgi:TRAP-type mannitol/chloroaromatic compound transport system permease small subunit